MRWGLVVVVGAVGCGRLNFSPIAEDAVGDAPFSAPVPLADLNSSSIDDDPSLTGDLLELYFLSERTGTQLLYRSTRSAVSDAWSPPALVSELDTGNINNAKVSYDGLSILFSSTRAPNAGMSDLWIATRPDRATAWSPRRIDELATTENDIEPWLIESDALTIYFASSRTSTTTLWTATRATAADPFATPQRLDELMSSSYDGSPWVDAAQRQMLFHSMRGGQLDIYETSRAQASGLWDAPVPVPDINSPADDSDAWLSPDGHLLVFTSARGGNDDLYLSTR